MRRTIVTLIARRELRDLLRDRRTLLIVLGLPIILYPVFGLAGFLFAVSALQQKIVVGVSGLDRLPQIQHHPEAVIGGGLLFAECDRRLDDPALIDNGEFLPRYARSDNDFAGIIIRPVDNDGVNQLQSRQIDALLQIPPDFLEDLRLGKKPAVTILGREGDETSKLAIKRLGNIIGRWQNKLKEVRFARHGLPTDFDEPIRIIDPEEDKPPANKSIDELRDMLVKFFPFLLVMWTMAGGLHPAIDLTAGEKERGTMETLLISPAERSEIVAGKFLAVWVFSYASALWNLLWMGGGALVFSWFLPIPIVSFGGLIWGALLALPLAAIFSSAAIGLGVFARSAKEGQYYLMPLFLLTLPLTLWSMTPGLKLSFLLSVVPITGVSLILQRLMSVAGEPVPIECWLGVIASLLICVWMSLWWAAIQFRREAVLFREVERISIGGWLRMAFRKDT